MQPRRPSPTGGRAPRASGERPLRRSPAGRLALLAHQVRYDLLTSLRNPRARFFTFFFPVLLLVIFTGVFGTAPRRRRRRVKLSRFYVPGILAMSIVVASYANLVISISTLRETGVLKRRRATPVAAGDADRRPGDHDARDHRDHEHDPARDREGRLRRRHGAGGDRRDRLHAVLGDAHVRVHRLRRVGHDRLPGRRPADRPGDDDAAVVPLGRVHPDRQPERTLRTVGSMFPVEHLAAGLHLASVHTSFSSAISVTDLLVLAAWGARAAAFAAWRFSWLPSTATA